VGRIVAAPVAVAPQSHDSTVSLRSPVFVEGSAAEETRLLQPVPAARAPDIADDLPTVSVQIEFLADPYLLGRLQLVDAAVRILERKE